MSPLELARRLRQGFPLHAWDLTLVYVDGEFLELSWGNFPRTGDYRTIDFNSLPRRLSFKEVARELRMGFWKE